MSVFLVDLVLKTKMPIDMQSRAAKKLVLVCLADVCQNDDGLGCYPTRERMAFAADRTARTIDAFLDDLASRGFISETDKPRQYRPREWRLHVERLLRLPRYVSRREQLENLKQAASLAATADLQPVASLAATADLQPVASLTTTTDLQPVASLTTEKAVGCEVLDRQFQTSDLQLPNPDLQLRNPDLQLSRSDSQLLTMKVVPEREPLERTSEQEQVQGLEPLALGTSTRNDGDGSERTQEAAKRLACDVVAELGSDASYNDLCQAVKDKTDENPGLYAGASIGLAVMVAVNARRLKVASVSAWDHAADRRGRR